MTAGLATSEAVELLLHPALPQGPERCTGQMWARAIWGRRSASATRRPSLSTNTVSWAPALATGITGTFDSRASRA